MTPTLIGVCIILLGVALFVAMIAIAAVIGAARMRTPDQEKREAVEQLVKLDEGRR